MRTRGRVNGVLLKAGEERVVTGYILSIKTLAKELMPYIITRPRNRNFISHHSVLIALVIISVNQRLMLALLYPIQVCHAPLLLLLFVFIPHEGMRLLHGARETYQQRKRVPLAPLCMPLAT